MLVIRLLHSFTITGILLISCFCCFGQSSADGETPLFGDPRDRRPKNIQESFEKRRIEQEKKDFDKMIERGKQALRISSQIERSYNTHGTLSARDISQLGTLEKLSKQIRKNLGGDDDDDGSKVGVRSAPDAAVRTLREKTEQLVEELEKTTRFTISAAAIQTSNAVVRLTRILRGKR